jgi:hypothetical protein
VTHGMSAATPTEINSVVKSTADTVVKSPMVKYGGQGGSEVGASVTEAVNNSDIEMVDLGANHQRNGEGSSPGRDKKVCVYVCLGCVFVCVCICICICIYVYTHTHTCMCKHCA